MAADHQDGCGGEGESGENIGHSRLKIQNQMRFLLDTNILIPLENSQIVLGESLANFVRLANENGHKLLYHPASEDDINRDSNILRRGQTMERLKQYVRLEDRRN